MPYGTLRLALSTFALGAAFGCGGAAAAPAVASTSTASRTAQTAVPAGQLRDDVIGLRFAVLVPENRSDLPALAAGIVRQHVPDVPIVSAPDEETPRPWLSFRFPAISEGYRLPAESLEYMGKGLGDGDTERVTGAAQVVVVIGVAPAERADALHRGMLAAVGALAEQVQGYPWDEETRQIYSRSLWAEERLSWRTGVPDMSQHVHMHAYVDGELIRIVTLGMAKFGYPDLVVNQVAGGMTASMGNLINLAAQTLVERGGLAQASMLELSLDAIGHPGARAEQNTNIYESAQRRVAIPVAIGEPDEGDADNRLIELRFDPQPGESPQAAHSRTLSLLYGSHDEMVLVANDDPEVLAASRRARAELDALRPIFTRGLSPGERLLVKAPFRTRSNSNEWMWVEIVRWDGDQIAGILANDPFDIPELKAGARVEVQASSVFDYIHQRADGSQGGNLTGPIIERRGTQRRQK